MPRMSLLNVRAELAAVTKKKEELEMLAERLRSRRAQRLEGLPARLGYESHDELLLALLPFASPSLRARFGMQGSNAGNGAKPVRHRGRGTRYAEDVKAAIRKGLEEGISATELSRRYGPTPFSICRWRKQWGLRSRKHQHKSM